MAGLGFGLNTQLRMLCKPQHEICPIMQLRAAVQGTHRLADQRSHQQDEGQADKQERC